LFQTHASGWFGQQFASLSCQIIARAKQTGEDPVALSERFCEEFREDMKALRCLPPTLEPKVTTHIPQIVSMIQQVSFQKESKMKEGIFGSARFEQVRTTAWWLFFHWKLG
jgi:cysteinyl-tRNA synthetase